MKPALSALQQFFKLESASGICLMVAALLAMLCANSPLSADYYALLHTVIAWHPVDFWINDALMAIFFLLIGLEIKRELVEGELSSLGQALLPTVAAAGGMLVPALIYVAFNYDNPLALRGWAIPSATDIAFSLAVLTLLGSRVPFALKIFLTALAVIDDLGAILIIALFYTHGLALDAFAIALGCLLILFLMNRNGVGKLLPYLFIGVILWAAVLQSGIHPTIAGVALGLLIPIRASGRTPLQTLEHILHPWVAYAILPLFAFANAGVTLAGMSSQVLLEPIPLGIALGLFLGKQIGIFSFSAALIKFGPARLPTDATWLQFYGICLLAGIGFTMSLFIGTLAFRHGMMMTEVRVGVMLGSLISALCGYLLLRRALAG